MNDTGTETYTARITSLGHDTGMRLHWEETEGTFGRIPTVGPRLRQFSQGVVRVDGTRRW